MFMSPRLVGDRKKRVDAELRTRGVDPGTCAVTGECTVPGSAASSLPRPLPDGVCSICQINLAVGWITRAGSDYPACAACIELEHPVVPKPIGEGTLPFGGGGWTNPYIGHDGRGEDD